MFVGWLKKMDVGFPGGKFGVSFAWFLGVKISGIRLQYLLNSSLILWKHCIVSPSTSISSVFIGSFYCMYWNRLLGRAWSCAIHMSCAYSNVKTLNLGSHKEYQGTSFHNYPIILSIENHFSLSQQREMATAIQNIRKLFDKLEQYSANMKTKFARNGEFPNWWTKLHLIFVEILKEELKIFISLMSLWIICFQKKIYGIPLKLKNNFIGSNLIQSYITPDNYYDITHIAQLVVWKNKQFLYFFSFPLLQKIQNSS